MCAALGRPEWASDERFKTNAGRVTHQAVLLPMIGALLATRETKAWSELFNAAGVPCGPINTVPQVFEDEQVKHREMLVRIAHPSAGSVPQVACPMKFTEAPLCFDRSPPLVGQHTEEVLREIGVDAAQIKTLAAQGVI